MAGHAVDFRRDRFGIADERLHQMRTDLGRLDAEILQVGQLVASRRVRLVSSSPRSSTFGKIAGSIQ